MWLSQTFPTLAHYEVKNQEGKQMMSPNGKMNPLMLRAARLKRLKRV
jgi:hypothetical protein